MNSTCFLHESHPLQALPSCSLINMLHIKTVSLPPKFIQEMCPTFLKGVILMVILQSSKTLLLVEDGHTNLSFPPIPNSLVSSQQHIDSSCGPRR